MTLYNEQNNENSNYYHQDDNADEISLKQERNVSVLHGSVSGSSRILFLVLTSGPPNTVEHSLSEKPIATFCGTKRFIAMFTEARH
jgi:hypothetical protein